MKISKRRLIRNTAAELAAGGIPASIRRALAAPALGATKSIMDVEHVVILMQENRSFDHYFGTLNGVRGFSDRITAPLPGGRTVWQQQNLTGKTFLPFRLDGTTSNAQHVTSLPHGWRDQHIAWNEGRMDQWIPAKGEMTMSHFTASEIPFHFALANAFTICDAYFSAIKSSTNPNRSYLMTGMIDPHGDFGGPMNMQPLEASTFMLPGGPKFSWTSYPERLEAAGVSWRIYQGLDADGPFKIDPQDEVRWANNPDRNDPEEIVSCFNLLRFFKQYTDAPPGSPLHDKAMTRRTPKNFALDVKAGTLPQVSWLMPPLNCCEHPRWSPADGAAYIATILDALTANPEVWGKTAFFVLYDENDGYFDHVLPPTPPANPAQGLSNLSVADDIHTDGLAYGLGFRVPALVVSPWSKGGAVCSQVFDHTSVIRFMETRFGVREPNISPWRREICGDMTSAFDFSLSSPAVPVLPSTAGYAAFSERQQNLPPPAPPAEFSMPVQASGVRPSRPLPYVLAVRCLPAPNGVALAFDNLGAAGVVFHVFAGASAPKRYSLAAYSTLHDVFAADAAGGYDLQVFGPNGFLRHFAGAGHHNAPEVRTARFTPELEIRLENPDVQFHEITLADNAYGAAPRTVTLAPGARHEIIWSAASSHGWYDLTIAGPGVTLRAAGHIETGRLSFSDPAIG
jgi:phospholipase C